MHHGVSKILSELIPLFFILLNKDTGFMRGELSWRLRRENKSQVLIFYFTAKSHWDKISFSSETYRPKCVKFNTFMWLWMIYTCESCSVWKHLKNLPPLLKWILQLFVIRLHFSGGLDWSLQLLETVDMVIVKNQLLPKRWKYLQKLGSWKTRQLNGKSTMLWNVRHGRMERCQLWIFPWTNLRRCDRWGLSFLDLNNTFCFYV